jgi:hypothetical protein
MLFTLFPSVEGRRRGADMLFRRMTKCPRDRQRIT